MFLNYCFYDNVMAKINLDHSNSKQFIDVNKFNSMKKRVIEASKVLEDGTGLGREHRGWLNLPSDYDKKEFERIKKAAEFIRNNSQVLVVLGIGGSYLGARAAIEAVLPNFYNELNDLKVYFAGINLSSDYIHDLLEVIKDKDVCINVISKSGTTTEPAIAFRIFKEFMEKKYGDQASKRIFSTTDKSKGALKELSDKQGYQTFVVPDDVGGRYSVLTAVGLLPIAASGIDIDSLMKGAFDAMNDCREEFNDCYKYAALRMLFYEDGKKVEVLGNFEPSLHYFLEWRKQLVGESEGKDKKGLFPGSLSLTCDLHSLGQYMQDGSEIVFETILNVENSTHEIVMKDDDENLDGLNYLSGKSLHEVNNKAFLSTVSAHTQGGCPYLIINIPKLDAYNIGYLFYFFEKAIAVSGYVMSVNPFNQPGVELYKKHMFELLGKPGY